MICNKCNIMLFKKIGYEFSEEFKYFHVTAIYEVRRRYVEANNAAVEPDDSDSVHQ